MPSARVCGQDRRCRASAESAAVDWVLVVFILFKGLVFVTGMYFAIKWNYDQQKTKIDGQALLRVGTQIVAIFVLVLLVLLTLTLGLAKTLGMNLSLP